MTTGVELWLSSARAPRADGGRVAGWRGAEGASFRETLEAQRAGNAEAAGIEQDEQAPAEPEEERVAEGEGDEEASGEEAGSEPQVVREAQERLTGEDISLAERVQAWETRRASMHAPEGGVHTAGAASASVVSGHQVARRPASGAERPMAEAPATSPVALVAREGESTSVRPAGGDERAPVAGTPEGVERGGVTRAGEAGGTKGMDLEQVRPASGTERGVPVEPPAPERVARLVREMEPVVARNAGEAASTAPARGDRVEVSVGASVASVMQGRSGKGSAMTSSGEDGEGRDQRGAKAREGRVEAEKPEAPGVREVKVEAVRQEAPVVRQRATAAPETVMKHAGAEGAALPGRDLAAEGDVALAAARSASRAMSAMLRQRGGVMTMALSPESLGKVRIRMKVSGGCVEVEMATERAEAGEALSRQLGALRESLEARGLRVERLDVRAAALAI